MQTTNLITRISGKIRRTIRDHSRLRLRKSVAFSVPSPLANKDLEFSPHILMSHQDLPLAVSSAKLMNLAVGDALPWVFHDDGSLNSKDKSILRVHLPGCRLIERRESDSYYQAIQGQYPRLFRSRRKYVLLLKLADLHVYSDKQRILYLDSDVILFKRPEFLLARLQEQNGASYFNRDIDTAYITSLENIQKLVGTVPPAKINSGLFVLNRDDIALDKIETVLGQLDYSLRSDWSAYGHLIEQTCVAVLSGKSPGGACHLPAEYDVALDKRIDNAVCKHYVGLIRHQYELEGLNYLIQKGDFIERWRDFADPR